jgi:hypothetical protein
VTVELERSLVVRLHRGGQREVSTANAHLLSLARVNKRKPAVWRLPIFPIGTEEGERRDLQLDIQVSLVASQSFKQHNSLAGWQHSNTATPKANKPKQVIL